MLLPWHASEQMLLPLHASEQALSERRERRWAPVLPHGLWEQIVDYLVFALAALDDAFGAPSPVRTSLVGVRLEMVGEVLVALWVVVDGVQTGPELGCESRLEAPDAVCELADPSATSVLRAIHGGHVAQVGAELDAAFGWVFGRPVPEHWAPESDASCGDLNSSPAAAKVQGVWLLWIESEFGVRGLGVGIDWRIRFDNTCVLLFRMCAWHADELIISVYHLTRQCSGLGPLHADEREVHVDELLFAHGGELLDAAVNVDPQLFVSEDLLCHCV